MCDADSSQIVFGGDRTYRNYPLAFALRLATAVRDLPEQCAMRDGRKWKRIPFVILTDSLESVPFDKLPEGIHILSPWANQSEYMALHEIRRAVDDYYTRILDDYNSVGILVRLEHGHVQIGPALRKKQPHSVESGYYYGDADRRSNRKWVTVKRDNEGLRHDVDAFQQLLEGEATETQMHRFFEQHPALLMDTFLGVPISHQPVFTSPRHHTPDYALTSILVFQTKTS